MKFIYGKNDFKNFKRANENCYLLTNGLGGYSSTTLINSLTRSDHSLFTASLKAPNLRKNIINKIEESLIINEKEIPLSSQEFVTFTKNIEGFSNILSFKQEYLPSWDYFFDGVKIKKTIVFAHNKNTLGIKYSISNNTNHSASLNLTPLFQFADRGKTCTSPLNIIKDENKFTANDIALFINTNYSNETILEPEFINDLYFSYDSVDGRDSVGCATKFISYLYNVPEKSQKDFYIILSLSSEKENIDNLIDSEILRQKDLIEKSNLSNETAKTLVRACDQFICNRESTSAKTIIAGYPWFEDWGRDTMFALLGSCISTRRFKDAKDIFRSFIKYTKNGLMPNLFPEGDKAPLYNTVDASLLFIYAVYEYYNTSKDLDFIKNEAYDTIIAIISWYKKGTNFDIYMDDDYLIHAGSGFDQVTWMDVRFDTILPTPRHGKPVEINAFWYNSLMIASEFSKLLGKDFEDFSSLSTKVYDSFNKNFWNSEENCLKDVYSGKSYDTQIRSNQIWVLMMPFSLLNEEKSRAVLDKVYNELYTPYGLRTLSKYDNEFKPNYGGSHFNRDMAYHQGTVWPFPLGGFLISYLKVNNHSEKAKAEVYEMLEYLNPCLKEGCVGHIAEIYDGLNQTRSHGCFAQAWSASELLRVFSYIQNN
ncbi:MAG: amylo-alpha-1,6-glucosidase [Clostridium sp.]